MKCSWWDSTVETQSSFNGFHIPCRPSVRFSLWVSDSKYQPYKLCNCLHIITDDRYKLCPTQFNHKQRTNIWMGRTEILVPFGYTGDEMTFNDGFVETVSPSLYLYRFMVKLEMYKSIMLSICWFLFISLMRTTQKSITKFELHQTKLKWNFAWKMSLVTASLPITHCVTFQFSNSNIEYFHWATKLNCCYFRIRMENFIKLCNPFVSVTMSSIEIMFTVWHLAMTQLKS